MKLSFKRYLEEALANQGLDLAAKMLAVDKNKLVTVDADEQNEVLETGRELKKQFIKMVHGNLVVRLFKALGRLFARVEYPDGEMKMYSAVGAMSESVDLYSEIDDAASAIGTLKELTPKVRDRVKHYIDKGFNTLNDADIEELLRKADGEEKFAIRVAMKVVGRKDPSDY